MNSRSTKTRIRWWAESAVELQTMAALCPEPEQQLTEVLHSLSTRQQTLGWSALRDRY